MTTHLSINQMLAQGGCGHFEKRADPKATAVVCSACTMKAAHLATTGQLKLQHADEGNHCSCGAKIGYRERLCTRCKTTKRREAYRKAKKRHRPTSADVHS